jgi:hypothetical protein
VPMMLPARAPIPWRIPIPRGRATWPAPHASPGRMRTLGQQRGYPPEFPPTRAGNSSLLPSQCDQCEADELSNMPLPHRQVRLASAVRGLRHAERTAGPAACTASPLMAPIMPIRRDIDGRRIRSSRHTERFCERCEYPHLYRSVTILSAPEALGLPIRAGSRSCRRRGYRRTCSPVLHRSSDVAGRGSTGA